MLTTKWQVGIQVESDAISAVTGYYRRGEWQSQDFWYQPLHLPVLTESGTFWDLSRINSTLCQWRVWLPTRFSLRVGFPPNLTLQRTLSAPAGLSGEREIATFVLASVRQLFPESQDDLTFDYRWISRASDQLLLTLTRTMFVEQYCSVFEKAGFCIDILEIMPAALLHLPGITGGNQERAILYQGRDFWLWAVRMQHQWQYGWFYRHQYTDAGQISQVQAPALKLFFTSQTLACPSGFTKYQPLSLLSGRTPLPTYPSRFLIALGLAIRPEDG